MPRKRGQEFKDVIEAGIEFMQQDKSLEDRENMPEKACGKCKNFSDVGIGGAGRCEVLKDGTNIFADPPVLITEGNVSIMTMFNMDGSWCKYFTEMQLMDTDISQSHDPKYSRHQRQMQK